MGALLGQGQREVTGSQPVTSPTTGRRRRRRGDQWWALAMIAPMGLGLGVFYLWPVLQTLYFSFTTWGPFGGHTWTGLANYRQLVGDPEVLAALRNTLVYAGLTTAIGIPVATVVAVLLNQRRLRGAGFYRTVYFLPVITMPTAVAMVWAFMYNGDFGVINYLLSLFGIHGLHWISDGRVALYALVVVGIWSAIGYNMVILLAGLQAIPRELYEAAAIDGAGPIRQFFSVTIPMLSPSLFFVSVISIIHTLQVFDLIYVMVLPTNPALPNTRSVVYLFYQKGFVENDRGYAAAIGVVLLAIILLLTAVQFRLQKKWVHYV